MFGYIVPKADEVLLISGGKVKDGQHPFVIERGSKFLGFSFRRTWTKLSLAQRTAEIKEPCITTQGLTVNLVAVVYFKIPRTDQAIYAAGERFRDDNTDAKMERQLGRVFAVHLRSIVGDMTVEEIIRDRQALADKVLEASKTEVANMGLSVDSFGISHMDDGASGYIDALSAPFRAKVQQDAAIAQSLANQAAAEKEQESQRNQAEYDRQTKVTKAQYQAEVDTATQKQAQAGPLAAAQAQAEVIEEQRKIADRNALLRAAQLQAEEIAPAEAEARRRIIEAEATAQVAKVQASVAADNSKIIAAAEAENTVVQADADAHKLSTQADALAANDRINVDRMLIDKLPELVKAAAQTLNGANVTLFNGAEGANELLTGSLMQGLSIFNTVREQLAKTTSSTPKATDVDTALGALGSAGPIVSNHAGADS